jgi:predicted RNA-binding Zn-ribbon protein involved in translation (DUF1610 family)
MITGRIRIIRRKRRPQALPIEFYCSECGTLLRVDDANRGKMARCPNCGMISPIPADFGESSPPPEPVIDLPSDAPAQVETKAAEDRFLMRGVDGTVYGPVRRDELERWYQEGRINYQCALQRVGDAEWQNASDFLEEERLTASKPSSPGAYVLPASQTRGRYVPHSGTAILVLACIGSVFFPCAIAAALMGNNELKRIKRGEVDPTGEPIVRSGYVLGIVFSFLGLLPWLCCCLPTIIRG